jgi:GTPase SAR1 family protein
VYSIVDRDSFDNASKWLVEAFNNLKKLPPTIIVANKIDLQDNPNYTDVVSREEGEEFKEIFEERLDVPAIFMETSAKTGENIQTAFASLLKMMEEEDAKQGEPDILLP